MEKRNMLTGLNRSRMSGTMSMTTVTSRVANNAPGVKYTYAETDQYCVSGCGQCEEQCKAILGIVDSDVLSVETEHFTGAPPRVLGGIDHHKSGETNRHHHRSRICSYTGTNSYSQSLRENSHLSPESEGELTSVSSSLIGHT